MQFNNPTLKQENETKKYDNITVKKFD